MTFLLIVGFCLLGSVFSVGLAAMFLVLAPRRLATVTALLIPYAIGTLLGAAFLGMIPHVLAHLTPVTAMATTMAGIIAFFLLEKFTLWRHCHEQPCQVHSSAGELILIGDALHNFVDGVAIAAAFLGSVPLGIATSLAVIAHEVPQEIGDFAILLESGYSRGKALLFNAMSSLTALLGAIGAYLLLPTLGGIIPYMLSISAASFIYIALADLVPGRRNTTNLRHVVWEVLLIGAGVGTIAMCRALLSH